MKKSLKIALAFAGVIALVVGGYVAALALSAPDETKLAGWRSDLKAALAEAKQTNKLVVVKAGSKY